MKINLVILIGGVVFVLIIFLIVFLINKFMKSKKIKLDLLANSILFFKKIPESYTSYISKDRYGKGENESDEKEQEIIFKESGKIKGEKKVHKEDGFQREDISQSKEKRNYKIKKSKKTKKHRLKLAKEEGLIKEVSKSRNIKIRAKNLNLLNKFIEPKKEKAVKKTFKIFNLNSISKVLKDKELTDILEYLGKRNYHIKKEILNREFSSEAELYDFLKEDLINFLKNEYGSLKEKISLLRKHGKDVDYEWLKLLIIPSKIGIFESNLSRKDFDKVIKIIESLEDELKKYEEDFEKSK